MQYWKAANRRRNLHTVVQYWKAANRRRNLHTVHGEAPFGRCQPPESRRFPKGSSAVPEPGRPPPTAPPSPPPEAPEDSLNHGQVELRSNRESPCAVAMPSGVFVHLHRSGARHQASPACVPLRPARYATVMMSETTDAPADRGLHRGNRPDFARGPARARLGRNLDAVLASG